MALKVAAGKYASVHLGMQSLHPSVQNLGKTGNLADAYSRYCIILEQLLCTSGCYYLPAQVSQAFYKIDKSALVAHAYQCSHILFLLFQFINNLLYGFGI